MRTISILLGLTGFITLCVLSFNYVEEHESTKVKKELEEYKLEIERISGDANLLNQNKINVEGRLTQACGLLAAADIANDVCESEADEVPEAKISAEDMESVIESINEYDEKKEMQKCEVCGTEWSAKEWPCPKCHHDEDTLKSEDDSDAGN